MKRCNGEKERIPAVRILDACYGGAESYMLLLPQ